MHCGANLFWSRSEGDLNDWISVVLASLDTPFIPLKQKHIHLDSMVHWYTHFGH